DVGLWKDGPAVAAEVVGAVVGDAVEIKQPVGRALHVEEIVAAVLEGEAFGEASFAEIAEVEGQVGALRLVADSQELVAVETGEDLVAENAVVLELDA